MPNILQIFQIWQFNAYKKHAYVWEQKSPFATWTMILRLLYKQSTIFSLVKTAIKLWGYSMEVILSPL